ncbi:hypothetical protein LRS73_08180 [Methylobacterium currus]|uniref:hypothetical protein n=1 Tax=Methylobacterium currus TaxID=2051553 RepID=UPI001E304028|nr:hypothetical protein [Methylobacterium currus]UHC17829.1 hypothetical protein LRS73_08180 [Methylobacterium currus]
MTIQITEDETEAGGYALIDLGRPLRTPLLSFRRQDVEPRHLGAEGWQPEVAWLAPLSVTERDGRAVARFGPNVVDCIEELVPIEIVAQDGTSFGIVSWPFITPAPAGRGLLAAAPAPAPAPVEVAIPAQPPAEAPAPPAPEPESEPEPAPTRAVRNSLPLAEPVKPPRRAWPMIALPLVVLAAIGGAYMYRDALPDLFGTRPTEPVAPSETVAIPAPPPEAPRLSAAELRQRHARLIEERAAPAAFVALGETALAARQGAAAFRAFEEADPAASADAAWQLARFYDPGTTDAAYRDAARPNTVRAAYYYALWRSRSPRHTDALRGLCEAQGDLAGRDDRLRAFCRP